MPGEIQRPGLWMTLEDRAAIFDNFSNFFKKHFLLKKITEVGNHVGYLGIFFQPAMTITTGPVPEKVNMGPYGKTPLLPLFLTGAVLFLSQWQTWRQQLP
jgi:hypothetical protein